MSADEGLRELLYKYDWQGSEELTRPGVLAQDRTLNQVFRVLLKHGHLQTAPKPSLVRGLTAS